MTTDDLSGPVLSKCACHKAGADGRRLGIETVLEETSGHGGDEAVRTAARSQQQIEATGDRFRRVE